MVQIASISDAPVAEVEALEERTRGDRRMANLALSLEMDLADADTSDTKWMMGSTIGFSLVVSAALWGMIAAVVYFVF